MRRSVGWLLILSVFGLALPGALSTLAAQPATSPYSAAASPILDALARDFPEDHGRLVSGLVGLSGEDRERRINDLLGDLFNDKLATILHAPAPMQLEIEARHGAMLRAIGREDVQLCATLGDKGFFSGLLAPRSQDAALAALGTLMVRAASAGARLEGRDTPAPEATDLQAWLARAEVIEPNVPVRRMLSDREFRLASSPQHLCSGAAAMHEAVGGLPPDQGLKFGAILLKSIITAGR